MRFSITQRLIDWFKKLSKSRKTLLIAFMTLLIFGSPWLYQRATMLYNHKVCTMNGGKWTRVGIAQTPFCLYTYPDWGKACHSSEECMGGCVIYESPIQDQPTPSVGVCKGTNDPFGCYAPIEHPETFGCSD